MYAQCPTCSTIFDLADEAPVVRRGRVRCGHCREVFDAAWNLVEVLPGGEQPEKGVPPGEPAGADPGTGEAESGGRGPESAPAAPIGAGLEGGRDIPQKWTVSELDVESGLTPDGNRSGGMDEVITETLKLTDVATTQELENLVEYEGGSHRPERPEANAEGREPAESKVPDLQVPADIDEEIVIEAPVNLWNVNDEQEALQSEPKAPVGERAAPPGLKKLEPRMIPIARHADDVKLVQIPHPKPIQSAAWAAAAVILVAGVFLQLRQYYISDLAGIVSLRGPLQTICEYVSCTVPPRTDIKRIDLVGTNVDPHPATPGALRVSANLINRAAFAQPFPPLEVTLTDKEGEVVGRRTYLPHEYRSGPPGEMAPNVLQRADLDLAQPAQSAVGYEIQLVSR